MKAAAVLAVVVALVAWDVWRGDLPRASPAPDAGSRGTAGGGNGSHVARPGRPERDPFRYGFDASPRGRASFPPEAEAGERPAPTPEPQAPVRLLGFIRQGDELRAAVSVLGRVSLVGEGETVDGYRLLALEEDVSVRVRSPEGVERELKLPPR